MQLSRTKKVKVFLEISFIFVCSSCESDGGVVIDDRTAPSELVFEDEPDSMEAPTVLSSLEYTDFSRRAREGDLYAAMVLLDSISYQMFVSEAPVSEQQRTDRAFAYRTMALVGGICDSAAKVVRDQEIYLYLEDVDRERASEIDAVCHGRHGYVDINTMNWSDLPENR